MNTQNNSRRHDFGSPILSNSYEGSAPQHHSYFENYGKPPELMIIHRQLESIQKSIQELSHRMERVENEISIPGVSVSKNISSSSPSLHNSNHHTDYENSKTTIGEFIAANRSSLAKTLQMLSGKADIKHVQSKYKSIDKKVEASLSEIRKNHTDFSNEQLKDMKHIQDTMLAFSKRMDVLSHDLSNKIDNSSFKVLQQDADSIRNHVDFMKNTKQKLEDISISQNEHSSIIENHTKHLDELENVLKEQHQKDIENLHKSVNEMILKAQTYIDKTELSEMRQGIETNWNLLLNEQDKNRQAYFVSTMNGIQERCNKLQTAHEKLATYVANRFGNIYGKKIMEEKIGKIISDQQGKLEEAIMKLQEECTTEIHTKDSALTSSIQSLNNRLDLMTNNWDQTHKRALLASQFIEWYSKNGESYEHNLHVVDKHLKSLANVPTRHFSDNDHTT